MVNDLDPAGHEASTPHEKQEENRHGFHPPSFFTDDVGNLKFVNLVVRHPCKILLLILLVNVVLTLVLVQAIISRGNPFSDSTTQYDIQDVRSVAYDSLRLARDEVQLIRSEVELQTQGPVVRAQETSLDFLYWVYEAETDLGVFGTSESIEGMKESLALFLDDPDYESYCWKRYTEVVLDDNTTTTTSQCRPPLSSLNMYYASSWDSDVADAVLDELQIPGNIQRYNDLSLCVEFNQLCDAVDSSYTDDDFSWARSLNFNITSLARAWDGTGNLQADNLDQITLFAAYMMELNTKRGLVDFGFDRNFNVTNPVSMFSRAILNWGGPLDAAVSDTEETEQGNTDEEMLKEYFVDNFLDRMDEISKVDYRPDLNSYYFMGILIGEVLLDLVTVDALLALVSFLFVFLYIRLMVGSWFLAVIGMAEMLLSVSVSWFFYDFVFQIKYFPFLNTLSLYIVAAIGADDIFIFMDSYKQSASSNDPNVLESLESRMSLVYRRTGSAMAITSATTCSAFLCTLITPLADIQAFGVFAATVVFLDYVLVMTLFCTAVVIYHNKFERPGCFTSCSAGCRTTNPSPTAQALASIDDETKKSSDRIGDFFRNKFAPFINTRLHRVIIGVVFLAWLGVAGFNISKLEPTQDAEQFLDDDHPLQKSISIINSEFPTAEDDEGLAIYFVWGLDEVNRDGVKLLRDPGFYGTPSFLDTFEFNEQCQTQLLEACSELRSNPSYQPHIKQETGRGSVSCFLEEFGAYSVLGSLNNCRNVTVGSWKTESWQVSPEDVPFLMEGFLKERSCFSDDGRTVSDQYANELGWDGSEVRFAGFSLESSVVVPFGNLPEATVRTEYNKMVEISVELDTKIKDACSGSVLFTDLETKFIFMNNQKIYARSVVQSSLLGVGLAFTVLLLATRVIHIAVFATLCIVGVLVSVTGTMVLIGWKLGSIEAILISIVAGFSVDYVVHLAHAYVHASGNTAERLAAAFGEMGISVLNGMVTSVGASIPLFFCQLTFFKKFGTFLCLTIAFSWLFANLGFTSMLAQLKLPINKRSSVSKTNSEHLTGSHDQSLEITGAPKTNDDHPSASQDWPVVDKSGSDGESVST